MVVMHDGKVREWGSPEDVIKALGQEFTQYVENTAQQR
jgi:ABC-type antimicrobial peptide transport system ATPase subunit